MFFFRMSCFAGKTNEFCNVSLDRFDGNNLESTVYFLSHCHSDHMIGLDAVEFERRVATYDFIKLYCDAVTGGLLSAMPKYQHLRPYLHSLSVGEDHLITVPGANECKEYRISVTLIPAGHCPGSVMFLLQGETTVLYTGAFRFHKGDTTKIDALFLDGTLKFKIQSVYVDTTFCVREAMHIPSREECKRLIIETITDWFMRNNCQVVHVFSRSNYGYEYLMMALAEHFNCLVHVNDAQYQRYRFVHDIKKVLTTNPSATKIHFCQDPEIRQITPKCPKRARKELPCIGHLNFVPNVLQIIPSVMYFTKTNVTPTEMVICESEKTIRVCYSSHSSYEEIVDFLSAVKPDFIYPNVRPNSSLSLEDVRGSLSFLETSQDPKTSKSSRISFKLPRKNKLLDDNCKDDSETYSFEQNASSSGTFGERDAFSGTSGEQNASSGTSLFTDALSLLDSM